MTDRRDAGIGESTITIKVWAVIVLAIGIFGFFFLSNLNHEKRITTIETQYSFISQNISDIKNGVASIQTKIETHVDGEKYVAPLKKRP